MARLSAGAKRGEESLILLAEEADTFIHDQKFWSWLGIVRHLSDMLCWSIIWISSCSCHHQLLHGSTKTWMREAGIDIPRQVLDRWAKCPMRCRRAHELGDFMQEWEQHGFPRAAQVVQSIPNDVDAETKAELLQEFEAGRVWLVYYFTLKLSHLDNAPHILYRLVHHRLHVRSAAINAALHSPYRRHPCMQLFDDQEMRSLAQRYQEGEDSAELWGSEFGHFLACIRFIPISEQDAEPMHAVTHWQAGKAPKPSGGVHQLQAAASAS